jgi:perosamine synthetase
MDSINHIAAIHGLWVVEDAAEAHMATYKGAPVGRLASIATFSFYGNKLLTCGEGGALAVTDKQLDVRIRTLRGQGMDPGRRYFFPVTGYNFRLTNVACAILCAQVERSREILARRHEIFRLYREYLRDIPGISCQPVADWATPAPWLFCVTIDSDRFGRSRDELAELLDQCKIETRPFFIPLHTLPPFREEARHRGDRLPHSEELGATGMNLPTFNGMSDSDIKRIADAIKEACQG